MREVGIITTVLAALGVVVALLVSAQTMPDIKRYVRMRQM